MASAGPRILLAIAALCTPTAASGQATVLRGKVVNDSGDGIAGVTVTLTRIGYSVRTDSAGAFALSGTPGSMLVFTMRAAGYRGDSGAVTLPRRGGVSREFRLASEASAPPEVNPSDRILRGRVTDTEGAPLSYASVQLNGGRRFIADDSGSGSIVEAAIDDLTFEPTVCNLCLADLDDGSGSGSPDRGVDINDLLYFLAKFELGDVAADLDNDGETSQALPDGGVDINDLLFFLARFESGC